MPNFSHDTWNTLIAALSLLIAIASPFITYQWLDPKKQEIRHLPKLEVTKAFFREPDSQRFGVIVTNKGLMPATNITIVFQSIMPWKSPPTKVEIDPPAPHSVQMLPDSVVIKLDRALGKEQMMTIDLVDVKAQMDVWVYSDQGEAKAVAAMSAISSTKTDRMRDADFRLDTLSSDE